MKSSDDDKAVEQAVPDAENDAEDDHDSHAASAGDEEDSGHVAPDPDKCYQPRVTD